MRDAPAWATLSPSLAVAPRGWGWALALFPPNAVAARVASIGVIAGAVLGAAGLFARAALTVLVVAALYLLALPLRNGMPYHYQHLVWFAAICAASPCADALALDVWRRRRGEPPPPRSPAYGVPLRVAWLLVGVIFFFPGLWKLRTLGLDWITSDNLRNQMYWKWASTPGFTPPFRIDRSPALLHAGAAAVVALELSFVFAMWTRWSRRVAIAAALVFHASARWFMGIDFSALWLTYVMFVDWDGLVRGWFRRADATLPPAPAPLARLAPALIAGAVLVAGAVEAGARGAISGWPFACYPTFQDRAATHIPALVIRLVRDGRRRSSDRRRRGRRARRLGARVDLRRPPARLDGRAGCGRALCRLLAAPQRAHARGRALAGSPRGSLLHRRSVDDSRGARPSAAPARARLRAAARSTADHDAARAQRCDHLVLQRRCGQRQVSVGLHPPERVDAAGACGLFRRSSQSRLTW